MWPSRQIVHNDAQFFFHPPIVSVEKRNNVAPCLRNACIERGRLAAICFLNQPNVRLKLADDFGRAVSRPIVHNEDFSVRSWKILLLSSDNSFFDKRLVVVCVN